MRPYTFPTAQEVIDQAVAEAVGSIPSSLTAIQYTALIRRLDALNREFVNAANTLHTAGYWSWMEAVTNWQTKNSTTVNGATVAGATSLVLTSATDFPATGAFWIKTAKGAV